MNIVIGSVDYAPEELYDQTPLKAVLLKKMSGPDRSDYWLAKSKSPVRWLDEDSNLERMISYLVVASRWQGTTIGKGFVNLPVGIAYVTDETLVSEEIFDFKKAKYVAIGIASVIGDEGESIVPLDHVISGTIAPGFGTGVWKGRPDEGIFVRLKKTFLFWLK